MSDRAKFIPLTEEISTWATEICNALQQNVRNKILTAVCAIACVAVVVSFVVPTVAQQFSNIIKSVMIAFGDSSETIENFGGNSSTGLESRMIQLSGITWMLMHNAIFGLGASCHTRGKLSYYINGA